MQSDAGVCIIYMLMFLWVDPVDFLPHSLRCACRQARVCPAVQGLGFTVEGFGVVKTGETRRD